MSLTSITSLEDTNDHAKRHYADQITDKIQAPMAKYVACSCLPLSELSHHTRLHKVLPLEYAVD